MLLIISSLLSLANIFFSHMSINASKLSWLKEFLLIIGFYLIHTRQFFDISRCLEFLFWVIFYKASIFIILYISTKCETYRIKNLFFTLLKLLTSFLKFHIFVYTTSYSLSRQILVKSNDEKKKKIKFILIWFFKPIIILTMVFVAVLNIGL